MSWRRRSVPLAASVLAAAVFTAAPAAADTCRVPQDYATVQDAVSAARCTTIVVDSGVRTGHVQIDRDVTIIGKGQGRTFLQTATGGVIDISAGVVRISDLTIQNGSESGTFAHGAGVDIQGSANVVLSHVTVRNNTVTGADNSQSFELTIATGGGIHNVGTLTIRDSRIVGNIAQGAGGESAWVGGGGVASAGTTMIERTVIEDNAVHAPAADIASGGGIFISNGSTAVRRGHIVGNEAREGGGGFVWDARLSLTHTRVHDNIAGRGGGLNAFGSGSAVTMRASTIADNIANSGSGGGIRNDRGDIVLIDSTLSGNSAAGSGGGIVNAETGSKASLTNVTLSANRANAYGGGMDTYGGATATVINSTVTRNVADADGAGNEFSGGLQNGSEGATAVENSVIARNTRGIAGTASDCGGWPFISQGGNVIGTEGECLGFTAERDLDGAGGAGLLVLAVNGGPTRTHAITASSPARDRGRHCPDSDQRGAPRDAACDSGAYELVFCEGGRVNVVGTAGADTIAGSDDRGDVILGLGGPDTIDGRGGPDRICGGGGRDSIAGRAGNDRLAGEDGDDILSGGDGDDVLKGGDGIDACAGGPGVGDRAIECERRTGIP